jgi:hypothetical protein
VSDYRFIAVDIQTPLIIGAVLESAAIPRMSIRFNGIIEEKMIDAIRLFIIIFIPLFLISCPNQEQVNTQLKQQIEATLERVKHNDYDGVYRELMQHGEAAIPVLSEKVKDIEEVGAVRATALDVLCFIDRSKDEVINDERAIAILTKALEDKADGVRFIAVRQMMFLDPSKAPVKEMVPALVKLLKEYHNYFQILVLGRLEDKSAIPALKEALKEATIPKTFGTDDLAHKSSADAAKQALARLGETIYFEEILSELNSTDPMVRYEAINKLGYIRNKAAVKYLIPFLDNPSLPVEPEEPKEDSFCYAIVFQTYAYAAVDALNRIVNQPLFDQQAEIGDIRDEDIERWKQWWETHKNEFE